MTGHSTSVHTQITKCINVLPLSSSSNKLTLHTCYKNGYSKERFGQQRWNCSKEMKSGNAGDETQLKSLLKK